MSRLDPGIPLNARPPMQMADPMEGYGKIQSLKNMMQQGQINEQSLRLNDERIRGERIGNDVQERALQADKLLSDAIQANTKLTEDGDFGIDHDKVEAALMRAGFNEKALQYSKTRKEIETAAFDHVTKELELASKKAKRIGAVAQSVLNADPSLRPMVYSAALKQLLSEKVIDMKTLQEKGISPEYQGQQTDAMLQQIADSAAEDPYGEYTKRMTEKRAAATAAQQAASATAKLPGEQADALKKQLETEATLLGGAMTQEDWDTARSQLPEGRRKFYPSNFTEETRARVAMMLMSEKERQEINEASSIEELAQRAQVPGPRGEAAKAALKTLEQREIRIEAAKAQAKAAAEMSALGAGAADALAGSTKVNEDVLAQLTPAAIADVKSVVEYKRDVTPYMLTRSPYWRRINEVAQQYDPTYDPSQYGVRYKTRQDFTTGKAAQAMRALNTVAQHLARLDASVDALDNYGGDSALSVGANMVRNAVMAKKAQNQLEIDRDAVANELENAYRAGGGSESGVQAWKKNFSVNNSKDSQKNGVKEVGNLIEGLINSLYAQYEKSMGKTADFDILDEKSRKTFEKLGVKIDQPAKTSTAPPPPEAPGAKKITPEVMQKMRAANPGVDDATIIRGLEGRGYTR